MRRLPIGEDDTTGTLSPRLAELGAALLLETLPAIADGRVVLTPQVEAEATLAPLLAKTDGRLDFARPARLVSAQARGVDPWPGATTMLDGEVLRLFAPRVLAGVAGGAPGTVLPPRPEGLAIACGDGAIAFAELQLPGRRRLPAAAVLAGRPIPPGTRFGTS
jgi:methionyl-tRNA formyltransferase